MKRTAFILMPIILLLLASCGNIYDENTAAYEGYQYVEIIEKSEAVSITWQEAYADFLRNPANFTLFQGQAYEMALFSPPYPDWISFYFALRDLTQDGIPQLLVFFYGSSSACGSGFDIYSFDGEGIVFLDGAFTSRAQRGLSVSNDPYFPGMFFGYGMMGWGYNHYVELVGGQTKITDVLIYEYLYGSGKIIHTQANQQLYDAWQQRIFFPTHEITEDNIRDVVFGWQPPAATWQEAYTAILQNYLGQGTFFLHDIDRDGTPELVIIHHQYDAVYSFADGAAMPIVLGQERIFDAQMRHVYSGIFAPADGRLGIVLQDHGDTRLMVLEGHRLVVEINMTAPFFRGRELEIWHINSEEVTEAEHAALHNRLVPVCEHGGSFLNNSANIYPYEITPANIRAAISGWRPTPTWQEAYTAILRAYYEQYDGEYRLFFLLHDIDKDGIPELFISEQGCWDEHIDVVYTFRGGRAMPLEFGEGVTFMPHLFSASGPYLTPNSGNAPGVIAGIRGVGSVFGGNYWANLIVIDGNSLVVKYHGAWIVDVAALLELGVSGNDLDAITEHTTITINGNAVSEEQFLQIFGHSGNYVRFLRPHLITEDNIRDIFYS